MYEASYVCPITKSTLFKTENGLRTKDGVIFPYLKFSQNKNLIPNFLEEKKIDDMKDFSLNIDEDPQSIVKYINYLDWLFDTFKEDENTIRQNMIEKLNLKEGDCVLVTGCGLGNELVHLLKNIGSTGSLYAQDISIEMILNAHARINNHPHAKSFGKIFFSIGDAVNLPFTDNFFNAAFHFGGINTFNNVKRAIKEMDRVVMPGGKVVFGDEGVAPWLKNTGYGKLAICNNKLWEADPPLLLLPEKCLDVNITWIFGNCFYLIDFLVSDKGPYMNIDIPHKGKRGGTMRTRFYGQLEGVTLETKNKVVGAAEAEGKSVHEWLEGAILEALSNKK